MKTEKLRKIKQKNEKLNRVKFVDPFTGTTLNYE